MKKASQWAGKILKIYSAILKIELEENDCDDTTTLTERFIEENRITNSNTILNWLADNGGYCDCEILANVEEKF